MFDRNAVNSNNIVAYLTNVFTQQGAESYLGEKVSMAQHMLQAAQCAEQANASAELIVAALLHDIGHYSNAIPDTVLMQGTNNYHEEAGANFLAEYFSESVTEPIRQHVATKRYLCAVDPCYFNKLSDASVYTLELQGGPMSTNEVREFEGSPHLKNCIDLRHWDEAAKDPDKTHPDFVHYQPLVKSLVINDSLTKAE